MPDEVYKLRCRGQVIPTSRKLTYEVFVDEVIAGPVPTIYADVLCTVDGLKAFHARRIGLRLVPDWPLEVWAGDGPHREQTTGVPVPLKDLGGIVGWTETKPVASHDGFPFDYASLLACAWGRPSKAFGPMYAPFDGTRKVARLPGPPEHARWLLGPAGKATSTRPYRGDSSVLDTVHTTATGAVRMDLQLQ